MIYYFSLVCLLCIFRLLSLRIENKEKQRMFFFVCSALLIVLFQGLAAPSVGGDRGVYLREWERIEQVGWEPGFVLLGQAIQALGLDFQAALLIFAVITQVPITYTICKHSDAPLLGIIIYFALK